VRSCPVCGEKDFDLISRKNEYFYVRCNICQTVYLDRIPVLGKVYDNNYISYHEHNTDAYYRSFANTLQQVATAHNIQGRKYLDIGCGKGFLLTNMEKLGWNVLGVERERPTKIREGSIVTSLDHITETHNLVSLVHVIEHVEKPKEFLQSVVNKLDKDGVIFLYSHDAATYPRNNSWLPINTKVVGEHLQIITKDNICKILESLGLNILQARTLNKTDLMITANKG
jgi:cyclopropane fatty-acyl-phospholipid synthase-like methyltransferase